MRRRRIDPDDLLPSDEELEAARVAQSAQADGAGMGSLIGTGLGTAAGVGLSLIPPLTPFASLIVPAASALGGGVGNAIGSGIGGSIADDAEQTLLEAEEERQELLSAKALRDEALQRLLGTR